MVFCLSAGWLMLVVMVQPTPPGWSATTLGPSRPSSPSELTQNCPARRYRLGVRSAECLPGLFYSLPVHSQLRPMDSTRFQRQALCPQNLFMVCAARPGSRQVSRSALRLVPGWSLGPPSGERERPLLPCTAFAQLVQALVVTSNFAEQVYSAVQIEWLVMQMCRHTFHDESLLSNSTYVSHSTYLAMLWERCVQLTDCAAPTPSLQPLPSAN